MFVITRIQCCLSHVYVFYYYTHIPFQVLRCVLHPLIRLTTQRQQHVFILMRLAIVLIRTISGNFCTFILFTVATFSNFRKWLLPPPPNQHQRVVSLHTLLLLLPSRWLVPRPHSYFNQYVLLFSSHAFGFSFMCFVFTHVRITSARTVGSFPSFPLHMSLWWHNNTHNCGIFGTSVHIYPAASLVFPCRREIKTRSRWYVHMFVYNYTFYTQIYRRKRLLITRCSRTLCIKVWIIPPPVHIYRRFCVKKTHSSCNSGGFSSLISSPPPIFQRCNTQHTFLCSFFHISVECLTFYSLNVGRKHMSNTRISAYFCTKVPFISSPFHIFRHLCVYESHVSFNLCPFVRIVSGPSLIWWHLDITITRTRANLCPEAYIFFSP